MQVIMTRPAPREACFRSMGPMRRGALIAAFHLAPAELWPTNTGGCRSRRTAPSLVPGVRVGDGEPHTQIAS